MLNRLVLSSKFICYQKEQHGMISSRWQHQAPRPWSSSASRWDAGSGGGGGNGGWEMLVIMVIGPPRDTLQALLSQRGPGPLTIEHPTLSPSPCCTACHAWPSRHSQDHRVLVKTNKLRCLHQPSGSNGDVSCYLFHVHAVSCTHLGEEPPKAHPVV